MGFNSVFKGLNICRVDMTGTMACTLDFANVEVQEVTELYVPSSLFFYSKQCTIILL